MAKKPLAEELMLKLVDRPEVTRVHKERSPCGKCKRRVKITRQDTMLVLGVTEPDNPRYDLQITSKDVISTAAWAEQYLRRGGVDVLNK